LFVTERGYQGELLAELRERLNERAMFSGDPIIEQEYQKRAADHLITIRPDLIIHIPFERGETNSRNQGNFVAIEIKCRATQAKAMEDFESLRLMKETLGYPLTIFLNVDSARTFAELCPRSIAPQTRCFAVKLENGRVKIIEQACT
jgi:hypothetical protein